MAYRNPNLSWQLQEDEYLLQKDIDFDLSKCEWNGITQNEENITNILEEQTPVKACGDVPYHFIDCDIMTKIPEESEDLSPPSKRRRMLDFNDVSEDILSSTLESKERIDSIDDFLSQLSQWEASLPEDLSPSSFDDLSQSEAWFADCLDVTSMNINSNDGNGYIPSDIQTGNSGVIYNAYSPFAEVCSNAHHSAHNMAQQTVRSSRNVVFKGTKSYMRPPPKQASTIVYPFEFIKPCSLRGDVTLKDINHKIQTPKPKEVKEDPPISAFSGKLVVGKTRIPTQGGKGSITIMRTKG